MVSTTIKRTGWPFVFNFILIFSLELPCCSWAYRSSCWWSYRWRGSFSTTYKGSGTYTPKTNFRWVNKLFTINKYCLFRSSNGDRRRRRFHRDVYSRVRTVVFPINFHHETIVQTIIIYNQQNRIRNVTRNAVIWPHRTSIPPPPCCPKQNVPIVFFYSGKQSIFSDLWCVRDTWQPVKPRKPRTWSGPTSIMLERVSNSKSFRFFSPHNNVSAFVHRNTYTCRTAQPSPSLDTSKMS